MAYTKGKKEEGRKPDMVLRARQAEGSDFYLTLGAAWEIEVNGQKAYSIKLTALPIAFDGSILMLPPKE